MIIRVWEIGVKRLFIKFKKTLDKGQVVCYNKAKLRDRQNKRFENKNRQNKETNKWIRRKWEQF